MNGLSREMIIHPGETLKEVLDDRNMSQQELALRTSVSAKHISTVVNGQRPISPSFAKKLEYALGIDAIFWLNLQTNYDKELLEFEEHFSITLEEKKIVSKSLKELLSDAKNKILLKLSNDVDENVLNLRKILQISNLEAIPKVLYKGAFRAQTSNILDPYVLFTWQKLCELYCENKHPISLTKEKKKELLISEIPNFKKLMFLDQHKLVSELELLFARCGIAFAIMPTYKGAPVQGFIKTTNDNKTILAMTFRQKKADIFWFTLFHEIGHFINEDTNQIIDYESIDSPSEIIADSFAQDNLINSNDYNIFLKNNNFSLSSIKAFAIQEKVPNFIIIGRLQKDNLVPWTSFTNEMIKFDNNIY